jgi:hypothetical protein
VSYPDDEGVPTCQVQRNHIGRLDPEDARSTDMTDSLSPTSVPRENEWTGFPMRGIAN